MSRLAEMLEVCREVRRLVADRSRARDAARWMCPSCNTVHPFTGEITVFTGLQFPSCCGFPAGHRQFKCHATRQGQG